MMLTKDDEVIVMERSGYTLSLLTTPAVVIIHSAPAAYHLLLYHLLLMCSVLIVRGSSVVCEVGAAHFAAVWVCDVRVV